MTLTPEERNESHRIRNADRNAIASKAGRDIGPIPNIARPARRRKAAKDFRFFCDSYFPLTFHLPWSTDHLKVMAKIKRAVTRGGLFAMAMPRGSGKSSLAEVACIWALVNGHREFVCLIGSDEQSAASMLESIKIELDSNERLAADYPEVCFPIISLEGISNRCTGQLYDEKRTRITWTAKSIVLPSVKPKGWKTKKDYKGFTRYGRSLASGVVVKVTGITGGIRGMKFKKSDGNQIRPSLVVIDDPQTDESARSVAQCQERERILSKAVLNLAGPGKKLSGIMPCNVIYPGDLADTLLDKKDHPEWNGERTKMVQSFPSDEELWKEYAQIRKEGLRAEDGGKAGNAFYRKNRKAMDAGAKVAWKERFEPDEVSAIQSAMNLKLRDEAMFWSEYQNEPMPEANAPKAGATAEAVLTKLSGLPKGQIGVDDQSITMFIDVHKDILYWMCCSWAENFTGSIVDYGTYPEQGIPYFVHLKVKRTLTGAAPGTALEGSIFSGLKVLTAAMFSKDFTRPDGAALNVERCLIDVAWQPSADVIYQFARQSPASSIIYPAKGVGITASRVPFSEFKKNKGDRVGHHWRIPNPRGRRASRTVHVDTNYWKTFIAERLTTPLGDQGCLSIFGDAPDAHKLLADHLTSEFAVDTEGRGRKLQEWQVHKGRDNHWLDCLVGCAVAASLQGITMEFFQNTGKERKRRRRISVADAQRAARERAGIR